MRKFLCFLVTSSAFILATLAHAESNSNTEKKLEKVLNETEKTTDDYRSFLAATFANCSAVYMAIGVYVGSTNPLPDGVSMEDLKRVEATYDASYEKATRLAVLFSNAHSAQNLIQKNLRTHTEYLKTESNKGSEMPSKGLMPKVYECNDMLNKLNL
jgi:hypothetical protein